MTSTVDATDRPTIDGLDLLAGTWGRHVPHDQFDRLRAEAPVAWHPEPDDTGFWAITKHADVVALSRDSGTFSSELGGVFIPTQAFYDSDAGRQLVRWAFCKEAELIEEGLRRLAGADLTA